MKGKIPHTRFNIHLVKGLIVAQVSFVQVLLFCEECSIDFIHELFLQNMISSLTISSWQIKRTILYIKTTRQFITKVGIVLAQFTLEFTWEMHLVLNLHLSFPRRPFRRHESRTVCCTLLRTIKITRKFTGRRYAFNTLTAVTPARTPYKKLRNAFGVNRPETFWRILCWGTDFEGIHKPGLGSWTLFNLLLFCATMTSLTRAKTEYIPAYRVLLFILKRSI